jgi:hypothetical protein
MMRKAILFSTLFFSTLALAETTDHFDNSTWSMVSGDNAYAKSHEVLPIPESNYNHSLSYTTPNGYSMQTDMCEATSSTVLSCATGDSLTLDLVHHTAILTASSAGEHTYYEEGYLPAVSPLSGRWRPGTANSSNCYVLSMTVPRAQFDATEYNNISMDFGDSGYSTGDTYTLDYEEYTDSVVFHPTSSGPSYQLLNSNGELIHDIHKVDSLKTLQLVFGYNECLYTKR